MAHDVLVETRVSAEVKDKAERVLEEMGMTVSDALRLMLEQTAEQGALPFAQENDDREYDAWFRAEIEEALRDESPGIPHEEVEAEFAKRRADTLAKLR